MTGYEPPAPPPEEPSGQQPPAWGPPADAPPPAAPPGGGWGSPPAATPPIPPYAPPPGPGGYGPPPGGGYGYNPPGRAPTGPQPPTYLVGAILTTLFCCLPAGVVSIVYAAQVSSKYNVGDMYGAMEASKKARTWMIVSIVASLALVVLWIALAVATSGSSTTNQYNYP